MWNDQPEDLSRDRRSKTVTIADVASRAGVSHQTVSNVLNGRKKSMATATYRRIMDVMDELGYHPNAHARRLRSNHAGALGLTLIDPSRGFLADAFIVEVMAGIGDVLRRHNYELLIHGIDPAKSESPRDVVAPLGERRVDGMILIASGPWAQRQPYVEALVKSGYPAVFLQEQAQAPHVCCLRTDDMAGALSATEYLIEMGHRRIGFLTGLVSWPAVEARHQGYVQALPSHQWNQPQPYIVASEWTRQSAASAVAVFLQNTDRSAWPTALLCANDVLAVGALQAVKMMGLRVPDQLAIVGFDDMDLCCYTDPQLTTVNVPAYDMGAYAATSLLQWLSERAFRSQDVVFPARFIRRGSA